MTPAPNDSPVEPDFDQWALELDGDYTESMLEDVAGLLRAAWQATPEGGQEGYDEAVAIVGILVTAPHSSTDSKTGLVTHTLKPEHVPIFNRLMGDFCAGRVPGRPNIVEHCAALEAALRERERLDEAVALIACWATENPEDVSFSGADACEWIRRALKPARARKGEE